MKERPILFSGPLVRALLDGKKTVTRRLVKPRAPAPYQVIDEGDDGKPWLFTMDDAGHYHPAVSPYGTPGERLWVKETHALRVDCEAGSEKAKHYALYRATYDADFGSEWHNYGGRWKPSIFMPRWASRITLEVESVRVERLQDITEEDAKAEGVEPHWSMETWLCVPKGDGGAYEVFVEPDEEERAELALVKHQPSSQLSTARDQFGRLWNEINGERADWASNPWVWVVGFKHVDPS